MPGDHYQRIHACLAALRERAGRDARLETEAQRARREFFGGGEPWFPGDAEANAAAETRFVEWFLLERDSEVLGAVPLDVLGKESERELLADSVVGVFAIERVRGGSADGRDLQSDQVHDLRLDGERLRQADVVVGRLYPLDDGSLLPSAAVAVYRPGAPLAQALQADLARLALDRRLSQRELEQLLVARSAAAARAAGAPAPPLEHLEAELEQLLQAGGCDWSAAEVSLQLAEAVRPGAAVGPLLDQLAFDYKVDLDGVRRVLLAIWHAHHANARELAAAPEATPAGTDPEPEPAEPRPGESLGQRLVRTLDEGLARRQNVEDLFRTLEHMAGVEEDGGDEEAADAPGDLAPLVQEYVWEQGEAAADDRATLQLWVQLQHNAAVPRTDLELVTGIDLMRVLLHVYLAAPPDRRSTAVRAAFAALQRFYAWAQETQGYQLAAVLGDCRGALLDHLDRLQDAGRRLSSAMPPDAPAPCMMHVEEVSPAGFGVRLDTGDAVWIAAGAEVGALLRPGDLLLGALQRSGHGGRLGGLVVALPPDAESLVG